MAVKKMSAFKTKKKFRNGCPISWGAENNVLFHTIKKKKYPTLEAAMSALHSKVKAFR